MIWLKIVIVILELNKKTSWSRNQTRSLDSGSCGQMTEMISLWKWPIDRVRKLGSITAKKCKRLVNSCCRRGSLKPGQTVLMILCQDSRRESLLTPCHIIPQGGWPCLFSGLMTDLLFSHLIETIESAYENKCEGRFIDRDRKRVGKLENSAHCPALTKFSKKKILCGLASDS